MDLDIKSFSEDQRKVLVEALEDLVSDLVLAEDYGKKNEMYLVLDQLNQVLSDLNFILRELQGKPRIYCEEYFAQKMLAKNGVV